MTLLYEYGDWQSIGDSEELKNFLRDIWSTRDGELPESSEEVDSRYQPFLQFDNHFIRGKNYVGFIQHHDNLIEIYPKVFRNTPNPQQNIMLRHLFYWFSFCRKWRFPFNQAQVDHLEVDRFPEFIIYLIAHEFHETLSTQPFTQYQAIESRSSTPRGAVNFTRYASKSLSMGNNHLIEYDEEPFLYDNKVNRVIKYCSRLLMNTTRLVENQRLLQEVIFILDEVEDTQVSAMDCDVTVNPFFSNYLEIMATCRSILKQQVYSNKAYDFSQWCLLLPMDYIFEDFVAGFIETHFSEHWIVNYQASDTFLSTMPRAFQMRHDILLEARNEENGRRIIVDTKYKLRECNEGDPKKGIDQNDLYQVISYCYRRNCSEAILIYPNRKEKCQETTDFVVPSQKGNSSINIMAVEVPFWSLADFATLEKRLIGTLSSCLSGSNNGSSHMTL